MMCVCVCDVILLILDVRFVDVPAAVTQEEGLTGFLVNLPSAVHAPLVGHLYIFIFMRKNPSSCDDTEIRTHVPTSEGFEVTN